MVGNFQTGELVTNSDDTVCGKTIPGATPITINSGGTKFSVGQKIKFSGGDGVGLQAEISLVDSTTGAIKEIKVSNPGAGYYNTAPTIIFPKSTTEENLLKYSEELQQSDWNLTRATISTNAINDPDGNATADKLVEDSSSSNTHLIDQDGVGVTLGERYEFSISAKKGERKIIKFVTHGNGFDGNIGGKVNLETGGVFDLQNSPEDFKVEDQGNGWLRISFIATCDETHADAKMRVLMCDDLGSDSYDGDGSSGVYLWGAQVGRAWTGGVYKKTESTIVQAGTPLREQSI